MWFSYDGAAPMSPNGSTNGSRSVTEHRWALRGVSFDVVPGMLVALVGPSGAGKSTLSYLIPRLYEATRGAVRIDGIDVRQTTQASLAQTIGMVTQASYLFHASIRANLAYGRSDASDADIEAAARAARSITGFWNSTTGMTPWLVSVAIACPVGKGNASRSPG